MARRKQKREAIEALDRSERFQALPMEEASAYLRGLIESALAENKLEDSAPTQYTDPQPDDKPKSEGRIEFENMISAISNRMHHHSKPLPVSNETSEPEQASDNELLPLRERIKFFG